MERQMYPNLGRCILTFQVDFGKVFQLPLLSTVPQIHENPNFFYLAKIEISSLDPSTFVVAAILYIENKFLLALFKQENKHWSVFSDGNLDDAEDVLFLSGELCILLDSEVEDKYRTFKIGSEEEMKLRISSVLNIEQDPVHDFQVLNSHHEIVTYQAWLSYLVESLNGELLLVRRFYDKVIILPKDHEGSGDMEGGFTEHQHGKKEVVEEVGHRQEDGVEGIEVLEEVGHQEEDGIKRS